MKRIPKIQLKTVFIHPQHGGEEVDLELFEMVEGSCAESKYHKEKLKADKSGGIYSVNLSIVFVKE